MFRRRHPPTDKVVQPLEWRVEERGSTRRSEQTITPLADAPVTVDDPPTVPPTVPLTAASLRLPVQLSTHVPPRIAGTPPPPLRIAGTPGPRGSSPLITNPLGQPIFIPRHPTMPVAVDVSPRRRDSISRLAYFAAGAALALGLVLYGDHLWSPHPTPQPPPPAPAVAATPPAPAAVNPLLDGRLELSTDHHFVTRLANDKPRWTSSQPTPLASLEITGPLALGHTDFTAAADHTIVAIDLDTGRTRFSWTPPTDEHWVDQAPVVLNSCLLTATTHARRTQLRCLDLTTGDLRWTAPLATTCSTPTAIPGTYVVPCAGSTALIDEQTGAINLCRAAGGGCSTQKPTKY